MNFDLSEFNFHPLVKILITIFVAGVITTLGMLAVVILLVFYEIFIRSLYPWPEIMNVYIVGVWCVVLALILWCRGANTWNRLFLWVWWLFFFTESHFSRLDKDKASLAVGDESIVFLILFVLSLIIYCLTEWEIYKTPEYIDTQDDVM